VQKKKMKTKTALAALAGLKDERGQQCTTGLLSSILPIQGGERTVASLNTEPMAYRQRSLFSLIGI